MVAFTGREPQSFLGDLSGNLNPEDIYIPPITISELAFKLGIVMKSCLFHTFIWYIQKEEEYRFKTRR